MKYFSPPRFFLISALALIVLFIAACQPQATETTTPAPSSDAPISPTAAKEVSSAQFATLSEVSGDVKIRLTSEAETQAAANDMRLDVGGQIQTGDDGRVRLDLSSGTIVRVTPSSIFTLESNEPASEGGLFTRLKLELGKVFVILRGGSMDVETPSGLASVRGSYLSVWVNPDTLDVYLTCLEGDCGAEYTGGTIDFTDGQTILLFHYDPNTGQLRPPELGDMSDEDFQDWLNNNPEAYEIYLNVIATMTAIAPTEPPETETPEPTCFSLVDPADGTNLPAAGAVNFTWTAQADAAYYELVIISLSGARNAFKTSNTSLDRYIESLAASGSYSWEVTAYQSDDSEICTASAYTFSKPESAPPPTPTHTTQPPATGVGNTQFSFLNGPFAEISSCLNSYEVQASDPDGISAVKLKYKVNDGGWQTALMPNVEVDYHALWDFTISANLGDMVYYDFVVVDGYGNIETFSGDSYYSLLCLLQ